MKKVLIVSPRFPPINAPDSHRVRHSLPHFESYGWQAEVWRVAPNLIERERDSLLVHTLPDEASIHTVGALNPHWTRILGLGNVALRSLPFYFWDGTRRLARGDVDLVYFSTTAYPVTILGRYWKQRFGVPYVIDMQDPWHTDYYVGKSPEEQPPKFWFSYRLNKYLEPVVMRGVDGVISVSQGYCDTLEDRYSNITPGMCEVIPFGAAEVDFEVMEDSGVTQPCFDPGDEVINVVYAGVVPTAMKSTIHSVCQALKIGLRKKPSFYRRIQLCFVGTSYAQDAGKQVEPIAAEYGLEQHVIEHPSRVSYFQSLRLLRDADHLMILGTDEPNYTASKLYPYILSRRPVLAVFNQNSNVVDILRKTKAGTAVTFDGEISPENLAERAYEAWTSMLERLPYAPDTDWDAFETYTAEAMTRRQVEVFDRVVS